MTKRDEILACYERSDWADMLLVQGFDQYMTQTDEGDDLGQDIHIQYLIATQAAMSNCD